MKFLFKFEQLSSFNNH